MKEIKLDAKDKGIINELDFDARRSYSQIARRVGLSKDTVQYRIKRLEDLGVIEGYFTAINTARLGYVFYRVCLKFRNISLKKEREIIGQIKSHPAVGWVSSSSGRWDIITAIWAKNIVEFEGIISELFARYERYFQEKVISTIIYIYHFRNKIITSSADTSELVFGGRIEKVKIDDIDFKILSLLSNNARISIVDMARGINLTANAVKNRIKRLVKDGIILAFRAKLNEKLLGFYHYKIFLHLQNFTREREGSLLAFLKSDPHVVYVTKAVGIAELEFEILVRKIEEFYDLIKRMRISLGDTLKDYESVLVYEEKYIRYLPKF
jgi:Lrp/AsnC family leucine-responsive transcriptional regulator